MQRKFNLEWELPLLEILTLNLIISLTGNSKAERVVILGEMLLW